MAGLLGAVIGLTLALTGAGGGVLAIPMLVFFLGIDMKEAIPMSLIAVCLGASTGALIGLKAGTVRYRAATVMGLAGVIAAPAGLTLGGRLPELPLVLGLSIILVFSGIRGLRAKLLAPGDVSSYPSQIEDARGTDHKICKVNRLSGRLIWTRSCSLILLATGSLAGLLSGLFGVGGGFFIIPALQRFSNLAYKSIQASSLATIALVSLSGAATASLKGTVEWAIAIPFATGTVIALVIGRSIAKRLPDRSLQTAFALITILVGLMLLVRTFISAQ